MAEKNLNRIKVMLAEKEKTNKWLAEKLGRDQATISKWCTNACKFKIEVQLFCSVSQANTMKNTAEVCPSGRRRKAS